MYEKMPPGGWPTLQPQPQPREPPQTYDEPAPTGEAGVVPAPTTDTEPQQLAVALSSLVDDSLLLTSGEHPPV